MKSVYPLPPLEMWGGVECTINRVGNTYFDQLKRNGHALRLSDLAHFAELGIQKIRYPIQWERIAPNGLAQANWSWADERLERLQELGITPIVGLTHHGSGPRSTSLIEPSFAEGLAQFAGAVAERYPWVEYYTPVNEPLTTARFSGLYGPLVSTWSRLSYLCSRSIDAMSGSGTFNASDASCQSACETGSDRRPGQGF